MALRKTLNEVVEITRHEAGLSSNTSRGIDRLDQIKQMIRRTYTMLCEEYDWTHLDTSKESSFSRKQLQAGQSTYNLPTSMNPQRITGAWVKWGSVWTPLNYGISYDNFTASNPDADQRSDPITNWAFVEGDQFEVWPVPATDGVADGNNEVAFDGQRLPEQLTGDDSRMDMDDILVSLMVATEILAGNEQDKAAQLKAQAAASRLERLRANMGSQKRIRMGLGAVNASPSYYPRHPRFIR